MNPNDFTPPIPPDDDHNGADQTRRQFLKSASATVAIAGAGASVLQGLSAPAHAQNGAPPLPRAPLTPPAPILLPPLDAPTEQKSPPPPAPLPPNQRVGFAVVGLGTLTLDEILPAFGQCRMSRLVALVTGERDKGLRVAQQYGLPSSSVYDYANFNRLRDNPAVEVIYIVLPNGQHEEFTIRGAQAGKHILCEKPMANNSAQARRMIAACAQANRKLMIAYRIQYETLNREARRVIRSGALGRPKLMETINGQNIGDPNQWRLKRALSGGGALPDIGLYCLNTTRFLLGEEPIEVSGTIYSTPGDPRFREVEENCLWQMRFPSGVQANCATFYGAHQARRYRMLLESGWVNLDPAYAYRGLEMKIGRAEGESERIENRQLGSPNQFAAEMDHMSDCVLSNKTPFTPGEEGLQDHIVMEAIYESARTNRTVRLAPIAKRDAFRGPEPRER